MNTHISHPAAFCNTAKPTINSIISNSNLVPHIWYHKILHKNGKPDTVGISILAELLQLHINTGKKELQASYPDLKAKFNYSHEQIYEAFLRLEKQALISRKGKTITFNVENVLTLSIEQKDTNNGSNTPEKINTSIDKNIKDSSLNINLYIDNTKRNIEVKKENYISGSQFDDQPCADKNVTEPESNQEQNPANEPQGIIQTAKKWVKSLTRKPIANFYPLSEEDAESLRLSSGREFNLHFINQLVLHLGAKYPEHGFYTKKIFLKYMVSILANEMRQAVNVNNESFRFKRTDEEGVAEEYLAKVEDSYGNKTSDRIRRKIAATFEPIVAYKILTSCYFLEEAVEGYYEIKQRLAFELSSSQRERLFSQISAVFGDRVRNIEITKNFKPVAKPQHISTTGELQAPSIEHHVSNNTTLWGRIRSSLIDLYGEAIDKSWFSRLETAEDMNSRSL